MLDKGVERRGPPKPASGVSQVLSTIGRLALPVAALSSCFGLIAQLWSTPARDFHFLIKFHSALDPMDGRWLSWGVVLVPLVFFIVNLINRRYGSALALWAVVISWLLLGGILFWAAEQGMLVSFTEDGAIKTQAISFAVALLVGEILCIYFFDWLRGIPWWQAPFVGTLIAGLAYTFIYHVIAYRLDHDTLEGVWSGDIWPRLLALSALQLAWALLQLLPTAALRGLIRPLPGYGGA
ncbi:MAG: VUT family protein [Parvibaculum sp.]